MEQQPEESLRDYPDMEPCRGCGGTGIFETECCNGSGGCSCRGEVVNMGSCRECGGQGEIEVGTYRGANLDAIRGLHFIGTGSAGTERLWPNRGGYGA